jgi:hypothetical protein
MNGAYFYGADKSPAHLFGNEQPIKNNLTKGQKKPSWN